MPTSEGKYAGLYAVTSSSIYGAFWAPFKLFDNTNTFSPTPGEYAAWHSGGPNSSFKPNTNESLNYSTNPYISDGTYVGGGNASVTFSTEYYITGSTRATASGEWVQINVPYNMKLASYSNLSRYQSSRLPVQYVILGSTDGTTWYAVDVVNIVSWDKYIPLKKYNINTTSYPYGNNYYRYFRYVIQKLDATPAGGDKIIANEGQWNLVGIRST